MGSGLPNDPLPPAELPASATLKAGAILLFCRHVGRLSFKHADLPRMPRLPRKAMMCAINFTHASFPAPR